MGLQEIFGIFGIGSIGTVLTATTGVLAILPEYLFWLIVFILAILPDYLPTGNNGLILATMPDYLLQIMDLYWLHCQII